MSPIGLARYRLNSKMVQFPSAGFQAATDLPQTVGLRQLTEDHRHKMRPTVEGLFSLVSMVFHDYFFKFSLWYQIQHLTEQAYEASLGLGNRNILLRASWLHFFLSFKRLSGQVWYPPIGYLL